MTTVQAYIKKAKTLTVTFFSPEKLADKVRKSGRQSYISHIKESYREKLGQKFHKCLRSGSVLVFDALPKMKLKS